MQRHQSGRAAPDPVGQEIPEGLPALGIECLSRFVEEEQLGVG